VGDITLVGAGRRALLWIGAVVCLVVGSGHVGGQQPGDAVQARPTAPCLERSTTQRPNILFLFADDQSFQTIRELGAGEVHTPNLDRLAKSGVAFARAYNQGGWNGAICVASRTMLNTGRFLWRAHQVKDSLAAERDQGRFWSDVLRQAGYGAYMTGKWHVQADVQQAFDQALHVRGGMPQQTPAGYNRPLADAEDPWSPYDPKFGGFWEGGKHWSEVVADDALSFLEAAGRKEQPFFMYIAFNAPHDPRQSPKQYVDMYPAEQIKIPESFRPLHAHYRAMGCGESLRDEKLAPFPRTSRAVQVHRSEYYAIISHMDAQIGRILDALQASGKADNTYVIFTADHGLSVGNHGLIGKQNMYEHSVRVPLIVSGPGIESGGVRQGPVYLQDVMPTTLEWAGLDVPEHVQFRSLNPLLANEREANYDSVYGAYIDLQRMVIDDGWKLILYPSDHGRELYQLTKDPLELRDLSQDPANLPRMKKLFAELRKLQQATGDSLDLTSAFADLAKSDD
jgi:choline-sulfatase